MTTGRRVYFDPKMQAEADAHHAQKARGIDRTKRTTWELKGTDEDAYVLEALRNHGVQVGREGMTAHLVGSLDALAAARAEYDRGYQRRLTAAWHQASRRA